MKKELILKIMSAVVFSFYNMKDLSAMKMPKEILMNASEGKTKNPVYTPVTFPHQKHVKLGCPVCHHKWTDKKNPPKKCSDSGCHDLFNAKGPQMKAQNSAYNAFHNRTSVHSCVGCHQKKKKENVATGPIACNKCHIKNK